MPRTRSIPLVLIAAATVAACGDDTREAATAAAGPEHYCEVVRELDAAGEEHFASLGRDARPEEFEAAERAFVEDNAARLDELQEAAPAPISGDVRVLIAAQRGRAGMEVQAPTQKQASAAEQRIKRFEKANC